MLNPLVTLTTDFGLRDPYVAEMKAAILSISPNATIVDISHEVEKFNIRMGAFILASASSYFPKGTIHVAIVDPGVGTKRRPLLIQTTQSFFIGPDNGVLTLAARREDVQHIYEITNRNLMQQKISSTFHGRDVFAPAAAYLANKTPLIEFGPEICKIVTPRFAKITKRKETLTGEVMHIDSFGNIITNFGKKELELMKVKEVVNINLQKRKAKIEVLQSL